MHRIFINAISKKDFDNLQLNETISKEQYGLMDGDKSEGIYFKQITKYNHNNNNIYTLFATKNNGYVYHLALVGDSYEKLEYHDDYMSKNTELLIRMKNQYETDTNDGEIYLIEKWLNYNTNKIVFPNYITNKTENFQEILANHYKSLRKEKLKRILESNF